MAVPTVKTTYSLDIETVQALERMARRWGVSKSEALRRAIRSANIEAADDDRTRALDELQASLGLDAKSADAWASKVRSERRASSSRGRSGR